MGAARPQVLYLPPNQGRRPKFISILWKLTEFRKSNVKFDVRGSRLGSRRVLSSNQ